jgi:ATP synthase subunit 6
MLLNLTFKIKISSPLEQFEIFPIGVYFNNSAIFIIFSLAALVFFFIYLNKIYLIIPNRWQRLIELPFNFIKNITIENINIVYQVYFPYIYLYFLVILSYNLFGMIPYSFTITSHLAITFYLALSAFIGINIIAIKKNNIAVLNLFLPKGVPIFIIPALIIIEFVSYIARVFSLAIRLFANMMSGHTLLKILAGFSWSILSASNFLLVFSIIPTLIIIIVTFLEVAIACLQAYVFVVLLCIYINDVLHLH